MGGNIMAQIRVEKPDPEWLKKNGVWNWPVWEKDASTFDWHYSSEETCYILAGRATVTCGGEKITISGGDWVVFPKGLKCVWTITERIRKHYSFGN